MSECRVCGEPYPKEQEALDCYLGHYERHGPCPDAEDCWVCVEKGLAPSPNAATTVAESDGIRGPWGDYTEAELDAIAEASSPPNAASDQEAGR